MHGRELIEYHVFLASPGDVAAERDLVRAYVDDLNRSMGTARRVRFQVIDWENFATAGVGRPQQLITEQTLERFRSSLALVVVVMGERFGTPSGAAESGTEEEVRWALRSHAETGFPEVKFFFRETGQFVAPADLTRIEEALDQWKGVRAFRGEIEAQRRALTKTYSGPHDFEAVLRADLNLWFHADHRPWAGVPLPELPSEVCTDDAPDAYFTALVRAFEWLDISGIDSDQAFDLPLDRIYVQLRVISGDDDAPSEASGEPALLDISAALARYPRLVIVGDPGSGKSTFLRFIALTLGQCRLAQDSALATSRLSLAEPLQIPIFLSCWDLAEHLRKVPRATPDALVDFLVARVREGGWPVERAALERLLGEGRCIVLVDGLDEVPTDEGRHLVRRLIEDLVVRHPDSRYVVTSRIRAYTGETVLGEQFARCDIQPFSAEERAAFLRNWVGQLFRVRGQHDAGKEAADEIAALTQAIETSSIRSLAVNPLLLTVIAIVHWNRKRLPEQRVDLYDECIDVLLGQRKQAEQHRAMRDTRVLDEAYNDHRVDDRSKVRKRFAEIAYNILSRSGEEIDRTAVLDLLEPHFRASAEEGARVQAERFLDRQELRSGLLVSRRSASYRFVHLTFQEYLAAWHLAGRDPSARLDAVAPHLREPTWFETLQLLGGELANRSDEFLDQYILWLLDHAGNNVRDQAPVVALAANVVRDTQTVASVRPETQNRYEELLRETLDAFQPQSKVPKQTQLDLLEAFGKLGASVKEHLISATGSRLLDVRKRALTMLVEHLSDDDLFSMAHVLADRSKEPVKTYLAAIFARDPTRAGRLLSDLSLHGEKTLDAVLDMTTFRLPSAGIENWPQLVVEVAQRWYWSADPFELKVLDLLDRWEDFREETKMLVERLAGVGSDPAIRFLDRKWRIRDEIFETLRRSAEEGVWPAVLALVKWGLEHHDTWLLLNHGLHDGGVQMLAADDDSVSRLLAFAKADVRDVEYWNLIRRLAAVGSTPALRALLKYRHEEATWRLLRELDSNVVLFLAGDGWASSEIVMRLEQFARVDDHAGCGAVKGLLGRLAQAGSPVAVATLLEDANDRDELLELIQSFNDDAIARLIREEESSFRFPNSASESGQPLSILAATAAEATRWDLVGRLAAAGSIEALGLLLKRRGIRVDTQVLNGVADGSPAAREQLVEQWGDHEEVRQLVRGRARTGSAAWLDLLVARWADRDDTWELVDRIARQGFAGAMDVLVQKRVDRPETWQVIRDAAGQGSAYALRLLAARITEREVAWELAGRLTGESLAEALNALADPWTHDDCTWERVRYFAESGVAPAVRTLVGWWGHRDDTWELVYRLAADGSAEALHIVVAEKSDSEHTWELVERLAGRGNAAAVSYSAWRAWAAATGSGESVRATLLYLPDLVPEDRGVMTSGS